MLRLGLYLALASVLIIATTEPAQLGSAPRDDWSAVICSGDVMRERKASCDDPKGCLNACARYCESLKKCYQCCEEFADDGDRAKCRDRCDDVFNPEPQGP